MKHILVGILCFITGALAITMGVARAKIAEGLAGEIETCKLDGLECHVEFHIDWQDGLWGEVIGE